MEVLLSAPAIKHCNGNRRALSFGGGGGDLKMGSMLDTIALHSYVKLLRHKT